MRPVTYSAPGEMTSPKWAAAFAQGCGGKLQEGPPWQGGPVAMFGSPQLEGLLSEAKAAGADWYYGDHAFFGRHKFYRCARNAWMHDGSNSDDDPKRFRSFGIPVKDWRKSGSHIVLCPNSEAFLKRRGAPNWIEDVKRELKRYTNRPIRLRWKKQAEKRPISVDLKNAWAVVTFTSNSAVDAILAGVPAFCTAPCAGLTMGSGDLSQIETPRMPEGREQWAARLANNQWSLLEMRRGMLWDAIGVK